MNAFRTPEDRWQMPPSGQPRSERHPPGIPHAVVIGSGFGGLASAVRLSAKGWRERR